ncbi:MAG: hypothetical protein ACR2IE_14480 [Candidatus Sumerlaeaceae bacterium]
MPAHLDYFPSRLHAAIYRNWEIVPLEQLAQVLDTTVPALLRAGKEMGLLPPDSLSPEIIRRNYETVLRRNWPVLPRAQIEALLGWAPSQLDHFLATDIAFRVLLGAPPPDLTAVSYSPPDARTAAHCAWFRERIFKHREATAAIEHEARFAFINDLVNPYDLSDYLVGTAPRQHEVDLRTGWTVAIPSDSGVVTRTFVDEFSNYCARVHNTRPLTVTSAPLAASSDTTPVLTLAITAQSGGDEAFSLRITRESITVEGATERALSRALVELQRRMGERGGPYLVLTSGTEHFKPAFSPRIVYPYFAPMTDVLGQDVVDPCPDGYLSRVARQDADGIWLFCVLEDLVPSPVFDGMGIGGEARRERLRRIIARAARYGLKVYLYFNEPRPKPQEFFERYPNVRGHNVGALSALCTSTDAVRRHIKGSFESLFREVRVIGGVILITASENLTHCYAHGTGINCERCLKRRPEEVVAQLTRTTAEGVRAVSSDPFIIVWDWSWHSVGMQDPQDQIVGALHPECALMADFERGTPIRRGGVPMTVDEYSISVIGPSPRAKVRSAQSSRYTIPFFAKIQLSSTWECGTVPFIPVPGLLAEKAKAMISSGVDGCMQSWTLGSYPSPNTEAFAIQQWNPELSTTDVLRRVALRRYGDAAADTAVAAWQNFGEVFAEEYPFSAAIYNGPIQYAPGLPWFRNIIPPPYGNGAMLNPKDDWKIWTSPYTAPQMADQLRHMCSRWSDSLDRMKGLVGLAAAARKQTAQRDYAIAWIIDYTFRSFANALDFYQAREVGNSLEMQRLAQIELEATSQAYKYVLQDSRLGWEAQLQYYYQPSDVMERLISLEAIIASPPVAACYP